MTKAQRLHFRAEDVTPYEHLEFVVKNSTPSQRLKWLGQAWDFWRRVQRLKSSKHKHNE